MKESRISFASPNFRMDTDESNPQENILGQLKQIKNERIFGTTENENELTFKKLIKRNIFVQDLSETDLQAQWIPNKQKFTCCKRFTHFDQNAPLIQNPHDGKHSPQIINLLQNCKASIEALQQQLQQKNISIKKLQEQKNSLSTKLTQSQKQIQRTHQILSIYMNESKEKNHQPILHDNKLNKNTHNYQDQLESTVQELKKINELFSKENEHLKNVNLWLQTEVSQINSQNYILNQKIQKIGKGVGKALSTIKKSNNSDKKISEFILLSQQKSSSKIRQHGKILTQKTKQKKKQTINQSFQTPTKTTISNTNPSTHKQFSTSFYETSERKLTDISIKAKRLDKLENLEQILIKMQKLAQKDNQQSHNSSH